MNITNILQRLYICIILSSNFICAQESIPDAEQILPPTFNTSIIPFLERDHHNAHTINVWNVYQHEENSCRQYPHTCSIEMPELLVPLSESVNDTTRQDFSEFLSTLTPYNMIMVQVSERTISNPMINDLNDSHGQIMLLLTTETTTDLYRFTQITKRLKPHVKVALRDCTSGGIDTKHIERLAQRMNLPNIYYLGIHNVCDSALDSIACSGAFHDLVALNVRNSNLTHHSVIKLAKSVYMPSLSVFSCDLRALIRISQKEYRKHIEPFKQRIIRFEMM